MVQLDMETSEAVQLELLNVSGKSIHLEEISTVSGQNSFELNNGDLSAGVYFVRINTGNGIAVKKLIVQ